MLSCCNVPAEMTPTSLRAHVVIKDAMSQEIGGSVKCIVTGSPHHVFYEWFEKGKQVSLNFNSDKSSATNVPPGEYMIQISNNIETISIDAEVRYTENVPMVTQYTVTHATGDAARDGHIVAHLENTSSSLKFLWTNGVITDIPELHDARPGTYAVTPISEESFVHACSPAVVLMSREVTDEDSNVRESENDRNTNSHKQKSLFWLRQSR